MGQKNGDFQRKSPNALESIYVNVIQADPAVFDVAPFGVANLKDEQNGNLIIFFQRTDGIVLGAGTAADVQLVSSDIAFQLFIAAGAIHIDILHGDPAVLGAAPGGAIVGELLQNHDPVAIIQGTDRSIVRAGTAADVQVAASDDALGSILTGGAVLIDMIQADPALADPAPVAALFQDLNTGALVQAAHSVCVEGGIAADVQLRSGDNALELDGGAAVAGVGGSAGIGIGVGVGIGAAGVAGGNEVHQNPTFIGLAPAILDFHNGDHITLAVGADDLAVLAGIFPDVQAVGIDNALDGLLGAGGGLGLFRRILTCGGAGVRTGRRFRLHIHLHVFHGDPAGLGGDDIAPNHAADFFPAVDFNLIAGQQRADHNAFGGRCAADVDLIENGSRIFIDNDGLGLGGCGSCFGGLRVDQTGSVVGGLGIDGSVVLFTACEQGDHHGHNKDQAQNFSELGGVGEIHGVTSLSSHFSRLL